MRSCISFWLGIHQQRYRPRRQLQFVERRLHPAHSTQPWATRAAVQAHQREPRRRVGFSRRPTTTSSATTRPWCPTSRPASADSSSRPTGPSTQELRRGCLRGDPGGPLVPWCVRHHYPWWWTSPTWLQLTSVPPIVVTVQPAMPAATWPTSIVTVVDESGPTIECPGDYATVDPGANNLFYELPDYWGRGTGDRYRQLYRSGDHYLAGSGRRYTGSLGVHHYPLRRGRVWQRILLYLSSLRLRAYWVSMMISIFQPSLFILTPHQRLWIWAILNPFHCSSDLLFTMWLVSLWMDFDLSNMGTEKIHGHLKLATASYLVVIRSLWTNNQTAY